MRAWLIRHGESESNAGLPTNGPASSPLTAAGRLQAERVAAAFTGPPSLIVTSSFVRAVQTAAPTIERFPEVPVEEWPVQEFTYLGQLHGPSTTAAQRRPHARAYWERCDPDYSNAGGGESFSGLIGRARLLLEALAAHREQGRDDLVAVFTHGLFMRAVVWGLVRGALIPAPEAGTGGGVGGGPASGAPTPVDAELMRGFRMFSDGYLMPNGCVLELRWERGDRPYLVGGDVAHLDGSPLTGISASGVSASGVSASGVEQAPVSL